MRTVAGGGNQGSLTAALERELARGTAAIISFGISGGLVAEASAGTWLIADAVITRTARWPVDAAWAAALRRQLPGAVGGSVAGADAIIASPAEKRALGLITGAFAVDMESHVAAAFAAQHNVPFAVFRPWHWQMTGLLLTAYLVVGAVAGAVSGLAVFLLRKTGQLPLLVRNAIDTNRAARTVRVSMVRA